VSVLPVNVVIGKYRIEKRIGSGGMGEVYRATNLQTNLPVAVKTLTRSGEGDTDLARFRNEAVIQYNLHHPNVAELYEYFEYQGKPCIVMEFVEGRTLDEWIREAGALELGKALEIMADICDAVSYMHSKGTIHRDIKAENIRVNAAGKAKLLDFGISVSKSTPLLTRAGLRHRNAGKDGSRTAPGFAGRRKKRRVGIGNTAV
jgi:serine/threonine protein kinase